jgi:hypothetical protein
MTNALPSRCWTTGQHKTESNTSMRKLPGQQAQEFAILLGGGDASKYEPLAAG